MSLSKLTTTERSVADLLVKGYTRKEIAELKGVADSTVEETLRRIRKRLNIRAVGADISLFSLYISEAVEEVKIRLASGHPDPWEPIGFAEEAAP